MEYGFKTICKTKIHKIYQVQIIKTSERKMTDIETRITDLEIELKKFELESQEKKIERLNKANSSFFNQLTLFFVAQSMLFLSLATIFNIDFYFFKVAICTLGLAISVIFFISFHHQLQFINHLKEKINPKDYPRDVNDILGKTIPSFLAVLWFLFAIMIE